MIELKWIVNPMNQNEVLRKDGETETTTVMKFTLRKPAFEAGTENLKEGHGDPWGTLTLKSLDPSTMEELKELPAGSKIIVRIVPPWDEK